MSNTALNTLLSRRSVKLLGGPGPTDAQIQSALAAVVRAPDHAKLRVWQFVMIKPPDITVLGDKAIAIQTELGLSVSETKQASTRAWLADVPLLVGLAYKVHHDHPKVPEIEQTLSMGAGVMNFQNAMHAMGFASYWSTGLATFTEEMPEYLGFDTLEDQFVGFLAVGTPKNTIVPTEPVDPWSIARQWQAD